MGLKSEGRAVSYAWTKHSPFVYRPNMKRLTVLFLLGIAGIALGVMIGMPLMSVTFVGIALMPVALLIPPRTRVDATGDRVVAHRQPVHRNTAFWLSLVCGFVSVAMFTLMATGASQAWRLVIPALAAASVAPILGVASYRDRGPLVISSEGVTFGNGARYVFGDATIVFRELSNGVPSVTFESMDSGVHRSTRLLTRPYNLDFDSVMSTLDHLQECCADGRAVTAAEIEAMLTAAPPDVGVGETVTITVPVGAG
ncbi:hypothetical protein [Gordonia hankookensis]|uniref:Uncharacterized protein n=1 Tax=Gordonia hankookensis TaxID=589403 RepID=A0ABR7WBS3_9ACTN|nr:hypothetical protein [Gordonia hankookensis]MBD1319768.1 hypothetical protein [Gordonia hankookensis]